MLKINQKLIPDIYSTTETKTNKIWINNKPIYRKVVISNSISTFINTGISDYDDLTKLRVLVKQTDTGDWRNIPWLYSYNNAIGGGNWAGGFYFTEGKLRFQMGTDLSNISKMIAIIEYTKTT